MNKSALLKSSLAKKYWMAATGLFLCLFLAGHLAGNLQLLIPGEAGKLQFNDYARFMTSNIWVKILSYLTYFSIVFHAIDGILLTRQNRQARPVKYVYDRPEANSVWASRNMGVLGLILLIFIVVHMSNFWYKMHWGDLQADANGNRDLHAAVLFSFGQLWYVALYVFCMIAMGYHLSHGFRSAFQSLGIHHAKYTPVIRKTGLAFAVIVSALFALIPVWIYLTLQSR